MLLLLHRNPSRKEIFVCKHRKLLVILNNLITRISQKICEKIHADDLLILFFSKEWKRIIGITVSDFPDTFVQFHTKILILKHSSFKMFSFVDFTHPSFKRAVVDLIVSSCCVTNPQQIVFGGMLSKALMNSSFNFSFFQVLRHVFRSSSYPMTSCTFILAFRSRDGSDSTSNAPITDLSFFHLKWELTFVEDLKSRRGSYRSLLLFCIFWKFSHKYIYISPVSNFGVL